MRSLRFVIDHNFERRNLNESQRALVAARIATLGKGRPAENASIDAFDTNPEGSTPSVTQTQAAELMNVGRTSTQRARRVVEHCVPAVVAMVEQGELSAVWQNAQDRSGRIRTAGAGHIYPRRPKHVLSDLVRFWADMGLLDQSYTLTSGLTAGSVNRNWNG